MEIKFEKVEKEDIVEESSMEKAERLHGKGVFNNEGKYYSIEKEEFFDID